MDFTGERVVPGKVDPDLFNEHLSRYYFAQTLVANRSVLDIGCGTGYGASLLAETAQRVVALDISGEAIEFAQRRYSADRLEFVVCDCCRLAVRSEQFQVAVCFEVIEHLVDQETLLHEISRVLKPDGVLIISTPNRIFYTEERKEINPFHTREFDFAEFSEFLKRFFPKVEIAFQNHVSSIFIGTSSNAACVLSRVDGHANSLAETSNFFVAVCSKVDSAGVNLNNLVYLPACGNLLREKEARIHSLEQRASGLDQRILRQQEEYDAQSRWCLDLNRQMQERTEWATRLDARIQELDARILALEEELLESTDWAKRLSAELSEKDQRIAALQAEFEDRTAWALQLNEQLERIKQSRLFRLSKRLGLVPKV